MFELCAKMFRPAIDASKLGRSGVRKFYSTFVLGEEFALKKNVGDKLFNFSSVVSINKRGYCVDLPRHSKVLLPALSPTMDMGTIVSWAKKEGDKLNEGDLLAEIETDKATMGFETPEEGYLAKILVPAGSKDVPIGKLVCVIVEEESDINAFKHFEDDAVRVQSPPVSSRSAPEPKTPSVPRSASVSVAAASPSATIKRSERVFCSPMAKKVASEKNVDLSSIRAGSGIYESIKATDVTKAIRTASARVAKSASSSQTFADIPVSNVKYALAKSLLLSKQTIPHYYLTVELDLGEILKLKKVLNESLSEKGVTLTLNDFIIKAAALASVDVPEANSAWMDTFIRQYNAVDVGVSVFTEKGFVTPVVCDADRKGLVRINDDLKTFTNELFENRVPSYENRGTISVANLASFGIKNILSIISSPQACVLGVGGSQRRLVPDELAPNGLRTSDFIQFTLSCDHRVVDGAVGAQWLQSFRKFMEEPRKMLL